MDRLRGTVVRTRPDWYRDRLQFGVGVAGSPTAPATWQAVSLFNDATDGSQLEIWQIQEFADNAIVQFFYRFDHPPDGSLVPKAGRTVNPIGTPGWGQIFVATGLAGQYTDQPIFGVTAGFLNSQIVPNYPICILNPGQSFVTQGDFAGPYTVLALWWFSV